MTGRPPAGAGWLHEVKHDSFRILARKRGERVMVWSRRGADFTYRFPTIADAVRGLNVGRALIDGEAVVTQGARRLAQCRRHIRAPVELLLNSTCVILIILDRAPRAA
jgi:ATP-dependent DNA ligase